MALLLDGKPIDYDETGEGPTLLLVPGSFSTGAAWRPVMKRLAGRFRMVTTSLPGYGGTAERRSGGADDIDRLAEAIEAVAERAGGPVHLVGHSFGGCVAMAVAVRQRVELSGLTMFEANPGDVLRIAGEPDLHAQFIGMRDAYRAATAEGLGAVAAGVIDFWGGTGSFAALPPAVQDFVRATAATNARDWQSALDFQAPQAAYAAVPCPGHMVFGANGTAVARRMAKVVAGWLPQGRVSGIDGASHFMTATHPDAVAAIIAADVLG